MSNNTKEVITPFHNSLDFAQDLDGNDPLSDFRNEFWIPPKKDGSPSIYFCGNSLGLQPKQTSAFIQQELKDWKDLGVEGHVQAANPWLTYHELLAEPMAEIVGAKPVEVACANTLTTNLHVLMASFYRPTKERFKILIESDAFPSDRYAVASQAILHGFDPDEAVIAVSPRDGETLIRHEDIEALLDREGEQIALVFIGGINYYTGQFFDLKSITEAGHAKGCRVGFDLAHAAGNVETQLHDSGADFAAWCSYKYLNAGPGSLAAYFVHERHAHDFEIPRFAGWWGHNKSTRFNMRYDFDPIPGAEGWLHSNPPILSLAAVKASLEVFERATMPAIRAKSLKLTGFLEYLLHEIEDDRIRVITPENPEERGCQLSIQMRNTDKRLFEMLTHHGVVADWREPDVIRVAPVPLYNTFCDVFDFVELVKACLRKI
jgi:kynureninase